MARVKKFLIFCLVIFLIFIIVGTFVSQKPAPTQVVPTPQPETLRTTATVTRVIDGDTIEIEGERRVRYIGVDTAEVSRSFLDCFARESYEKNKELVAGRQVSLEKDVSETDKYGRLLRYVYVDGIFVNDYLVRAGYAKIMTVPPDIKYQNQFLESEKYAKESNSGLWGKCL